MIMKEKEKKILMEINSLHEKLLNEPYGDNVRGAHGMLPPSAHSYAKYAKDIRDKVFELYAEFHPEYLSTKELQDLDYTCDKEVQHVIIKGNEARKRNAAQIRQNEFISEMENATKQIEIDISSVFFQIKLLTDNQ